MSRHKVTSTDVARAAGVSRTTVSYALNDSGELSALTRARVKAVAAELGYVPSAAARTLRGGRNDLVVLVMPHWILAYAVGQFVHELNRRLNELDMSLVVTQLGSDWGHPWRSISPVAVLSPFPLKDELSTVIHSGGCEHIIVLDDLEDLENLENDAVEGQTARTGTIQVDHLRERGHARIAYAMSDDVYLDWFARLRRRAVVASARRHGLPAVLDLPVGIDPAQAEFAVREWTGGPAPVTAVAAYNDDVAMNIVTATRALGLRCPDDLAVIGVDNAPIGALSTPALTTVELALDAAAGLLTKRLVAALELDAHVAEPSDPVAEMRVVVRDTT